jgi:lysophospholipid acyltransferase (LPLAT)-like uncharacterized protein
MLTCYCCAILLLAGLYVWMVYKNKQKEAQLDAYLASRAGKEDILEDWHDQTDIENPYFKYST